LVVEFAPVLNIVVIADILALLIQAEIVNVFLLPAELGVLVKYVA
jgi:hypothetical protein